MAEQKTLERLKERRLDRMRLGQAVCEITSIPSDPEIRVALVPLLEREYILAVEKAGAFDFPLNEAGAVLRDERQRLEMLVLCVREMDNLAEHVFPNAEALENALEAQDLNHLFDIYTEMVYTSSPSIEAIPEEEFDTLKKVFGDIRWSELTGPQWYAAMRFLNSVLPTQLMGNLLGHSSTNKSIWTNDLTESTPIAEPSLTESIAKSAESQLQPT